MIAPAAEPALPIIVELLFCAALGLQIAFLIWYITNVLTRYLERQGKP